MIDAAVCMFVDLASGALCGGDKRICLKHVCFASLRGLHSSLRQVHGARSDDFCYRKAAAYVRRLGESKWNLTNGCEQLVVLLVCGRNSGINMSSSMHTGCKAPILLDHVET